MNICDIATAVDENAEQVVIGIRSGEKPHEQMIGIEDDHPQLKEWIEKNKEKIGNI